MIYSLRKKFIRISAISIFLVFSAIFVGIAVMNHLQLNDTMDTLTDAISTGGGAFPDFDRDAPPDKKPFDPKDIITEETKFSTRFFTVWLGSENQIVRYNTDFIFSVDQEQSEQFAQTALNHNKDRGWIGDYRYKVSEGKNGKSIVFVNGEMSRAVSNRFLLVSFFVLYGSAAVLLLLMIILSRRAVQPIAESYEKQKQFITDANHELKTPLTLIMSNVDIVEAELGKSEWLDDIKSEGQRMAHLINRMVDLSRMDEEQTQISRENFDLSLAICETAEEFRPLAASKHTEIYCDIPQNICYKGDEGMIRQLITILLDNAVKYCDKGGTVNISLSAKRHHTITIENSYSDAENIELDKLFDRFYRADKARTYSGSFGIGLSIAREIVTKHGGSISAYKKPQTVGFKTELK